jgi:hypothetical protein
METGFEPTDNQNNDLYFRDLPLSDNVSGIEHGQWKPAINYVQ